MARHSPKSPLPIRQRTTLHANGESTFARTVHCPRKGGSVELSACLSCQRCKGFVAREDGDLTALICDHGGVRVEDLVAVAESSPEAVPADRIPISAVMTAGVVCVRPDLPLDALATLLLEEGFSGAPVVDEQGKPMGVISKTDLVRERHEEGTLEPSLPGTVADVMMPIAFSLPEHATLAKAAALMTYESIHRVPVVNMEGQVVGILSSLDVLGWLAERSGWLVRGARLGP